MSFDLRRASSGSSSTLLYEQTSLRHINELELCLGQRATFHQPLLPVAFCPKIQLSLVISVFFGQFISLGKIKVNPFFFFLSLTISVLYLHSRDFALPLDKISMLIF